MSAPYTVTYRDEGTDTEKQVVLQGMTRSRMQEISDARYPQDNVRHDHAADLTFLDQDKIAVMAIYIFDGFADKDQKKPLEDFIKESFTQFREKGTEALILDVRNNGGGADSLGKLLFSYLTDQPFPYYNDLVINALDFDFMRYSKDPLSIPENEVEKTPDGHYRYTHHPNWGLQQPSKPTFTGKVFVLMNGGSFSTTGEFLSTTHFHHKAVFIGEEAGAGYYGNTSGFMRMLVLPHTKIVMRVPFMKYVLAVSGYRYPKRGVMPDYPVQPTIADRLAGRDPEMEKALSLARKPS
jgi:C-terminal processing protease CtpA/Prc